MRRKSNVPVDAAYANDHQEDALSPLHGSDYDPCATCDPYGYDVTVARLAATLRRAKGEAHER